jgi:hypothetical protein
MTDNNHPITPPPELLQQWATEYWGKPVEMIHDSKKYIATQAARWGADQELEACCDWLDFQKLAKHPRMVSYLRAIRRPKPSSLKEQALQVLANADGADHPVVATVLTADQHALIRKALEQLDD